MGHYMSKLCGAATNLVMGKSDKALKIIVAGLPNAGKTTLLYKLALGEVIVTEPTIGSNCEAVQHSSGLRMEVWDLGGQSVEKRAWDTYFQKAQAVIYVVDASEMNTDLIAQSKEELYRILSHTDLQNAVVLLLANKADLPNACDQDELIRDFGVQQISSHQIRVQLCSAVTGEGLTEGLDWVAQCLNEKQKMPTILDTNQRNRTSVISESGQSQRNVQYNNNADQNL